MRRLIFLCLLSFVIIGGYGSAFSASSIHEYQLNNGLKLLVVENHQAPVVLSSVWYKVGSSYEPNGLTGISHMLEHMMFKGTTHHPDGAFKTIIAQAGGEQNAMTSDDFTMYYQLLPANSLETSLALEADRMQYLAPKQADFDIEHQVVMEERRMRIDDNPQSLTWLRFNAAAFVNNPYHHPVIGWLPDIQNYTLQDVVKWYHQWYAPNNAEIIVIGDVVPADVFSLVKSHFAKIPKKNIPIIKPRTEVSSLGTRELTVNAPAELPWLLMGYNVPALPQLPQQERWQAYALYVAAAILSEGESSRFQQNLVRHDEIASDANVSYSFDSLYHTVWTIMATPTSDHTVDQLQQALLKNIKQLQEHKVTAKELQRAQNQIIAGHTYVRDLLVEQALDLGVAEMIGLSWHDSVDFDVHIKAITPEQIQQVAQQYFIHNNLTIATLKPDGTPAQPQSTGSTAGALS